MTVPGFSLPPLGLYVHIPWCLKKCPYCDFNSHAAGGELPETQYLEKLIADLEQDLHYVQGRKLESIFIGGGTPSLFSAKGLDSLLRETEKRMPFSTDIEITLEANPGTFEAEKFRDFRSAGINRLSIGIQSFDPRFLSLLGRVHDDLEARHAAEHARKAGFDNFNLDLMFGLPGQSPAQAMADLETAITFEPAHLSWYQLTIEPNTVFYSHPPALPADDLVSEIHETGIALLSDNNLARYEVSAFSRPGKESTHNTNYWQFGDYIGIGAGAHGKITLVDERRILRTRKVRQPAAYLERDDDVTAEITVVAEEELPLEFMMNALRLREGVEESVFTLRTGIDPDVIRDELETLRTKGLLQQDRLAATDRGFSLLNSVLENFLPSVPHADNRIPVNSRPHEKATG